MEKFWRNERAAGGENLIFKTNELERMFLADAHRENYRRRLREIIGRLKPAGEGAKGNVHCWKNRKHWHLEICKYFPMEAIAGVKLSMES